MCIRMAENPDVQFVKEYIKSGDALLSFNRAGYPTGGVGAKVMAERTLARPEIRIALSVLADFGIEKGTDVPVAPLSRDGLIEKLDAIHEVAMQEAALPSAINAVKAQAQLLGYMDQTVTINHNVRPSELSLEDLRRMVSKELEASPVPLMIDADVSDAEYTEVEDDEAV
jgi:hypothetical protein